MKGFVPKSISPARISLDAPALLVCGQHSADRRNLRIFAYLRNNQLLQECNNHGAYFLGQSLTPGQSMTTPFHAAPYAFSKTEELLPSFRGFDRGH